MVVPSACPLPFFPPSMWIIIFPIHLKILDSFLTKEKVAITHFNMMVDTLDD